MIFIFVFENCQNSSSWDPFFGLFWFAKYLNVGSGSSEIRILSGLIQETYTLGKVKNQVLLLTIKFVWSHCPFYFIFVCFSFCADFVFCFWILFSLNFPLFIIIRYLQAMDSLLKIIRCFFVYRREIPLYSLSDTGANWYSNDQLLWDLTGKRAWLSGVWVKDISNWFLLL